MFTSYARASPGRPSSCQKATSDSASAAVIIVTATAPAVLRENERMPTSPLIAAPMPGSSGINQMYRIDAHVAPVGQVGQVGRAWRVGRRLDPRRIAAPQPTTPLT